MRKVPRPFPPLPLILALVSASLFFVGIPVMDRTRAWGPTLLIAIPALLLGAVAIALSVGILRSRPSGARYGLAMTGGIAGGLVVVFWAVMVPMLLIVALPAREMDSPHPRIEQSCDQMKILARQVKTFHREQGRLPVKLEELVDKGLIASHLLYDPRQKRRDAPSYRLAVREMPPKDQWSTVPLLEGRIPDKNGNRLIVYPNETCGTVTP